MFFCLNNQYRNPFIIYIINNTVICCDVTRIGYIHASYQWFGMP